VALLSIFPITPLCQQQRLSPETHYHRHTPQRIEAQGLQTPQAHFHHKPYRRCNFSSLLAVAGPDIAPTERKVSNDANSMARNVEKPSLTAGFIMIGISYSLSEDRPGAGDDVGYCWIIENGG